MFCYFKDIIQTQALSVTGSDESSLDANLAHRFGVGMHDVSKVALMVQPKYHVPPSTALFG
jgi:hypothetical protein